jgi:dethiobiotin synthetase
MSPGLFVTGTDTGVGKTLIASALLRALGGDGRAVVGMKPVAAGRERGRSPDVEALKGASTLHPPAHLVNPYAFDPAIAPHIAAELAGVSIDIEIIARAFEALSRQADVVVVEGVGGFFVPLNERQTTADLAKRLGLPVLLVVGMRLGCLNHALLTRGGIEAAGLRCAGWVANCIEPEMPQLQANIRALKARLACPLWAAVPFQARPDPAEIASLLSAKQWMEAA